MSESSPSRTSTSKSSAPRTCNHQAPHGWASAPELASTSVLDLSVAMRFTAPVKRARQGEELEKRGRHAASVGQRRGGLGSGRGGGRGRGAGRRGGRHDGGWHAPIVAGHGTATGGRGGR